jgi:nitrous oxidase accessory protein
VSLFLLAVAGVTLVVSPAGPYRTLTAALAEARPGDRIVVRAGTYREPKIVVGVRVEIIGEGGPVFEGGTHTTLEVVADSVVVRGLVFSGVTPTAVEDRAAILLMGTRGCVIEANTVREAYFGIYGMGAADCRIVGNRVQGPADRRGFSGNGIHLWQSTGMLVEGNTVRAHRDGFFFEFVRGAVVRGNVSEDNARYGLHFMRSDSCLYEANVFAHNGAGVAVMYSSRVRMLNNRFERNWGNAAYGLLLKDISDGEVEGNQFERNTIGLYLEGSNRNRIARNTFEQNGWAVKVLANASDNRFEQNIFAGNSFDVATNSRGASSSFAENFWDHYRGYDLDRDGYGDIPFRPVRLFSLIVEQAKPSLILLRSLFVDLLDAAERVLPILTPEMLVDTRPLMARPR